MTKVLRRLKDQCKVFGNFKKVEPCIVDSREEMQRKKARDPTNSLELGNALSFVPVMQVKKFACKRMMIYFILIGLGIIAHSMYRVFFTVQPPDLNKIIEDSGDQANFKPESRIVDDIGSNVKSKANSVFEEYKKKIEDNLREDKKSNVNDNGGDFVQADNRGYDSRNRNQLNQGSMNDQDMKRFNDLDDRDANRQGVDNQGDRFNDRDSKNLRNQGFENRQDEGYENRQDPGFGNQQDRGFGNQQDQGFGNQQDRRFGNQQDRGSGNQQDRRFGNQQDQGFGNQPDYDSGVNQRDNFGGDSRRSGQGDNPRDNVFQDNQVNDNFGNQDNQRQLHEQNAVIVNSGNDNRNDNQGDDIYGNQGFDSRRNQQDLGNQENQRFGNQNNPDKSGNKDNQHGWRFNNQNGDTSGNRGNQGDIANRDSQNQLQHPDFHDQGNGKLDSQGNLQNAGLQPDDRLRNGHDNYQGNGGKEQDTQLDNPVPNNQPNGDANNENPQHENDNKDTDENANKNVIPPLPVVRNPQPNVGLKSNQRYDMKNIKINNIVRPFDRVDSQRHQHFHEMPTLVTAASDKDMQAVMQLIQSVQKFLPREKLFIYDLGLKPEFKRTLMSLCGVRIKEYIGHAFPAFFQDLANFHWRPLAIQASLAEFGHVIWINPTSRLINTMNVLVEKSDKHGILVIGNEEAHSTNAVTHPSMLKYLPTDLKLFKLTAHVSMAAMILHNRPETQMRLMRPWMACTMEKDCLAPTGAKWKCHFDFTGMQHADCHRYDESALNIILKNLFHYKNSEYYINKNTYFEEFDKDHRAQPKRCKNPDDLRHIK